MGCPPKVRSALSKVDGIEAVEIGQIDKATKSAVVQVKGKVSDKALIAAFEGTQYTAAVK